MRIRESLKTARMRARGRDATRRDEGRSRPPVPGSTGRHLPTWLIYSSGFILIVFGVLFLGRDVILRPWTARQWTGAVAVGDVVYVFGGQTVSSDEGLLDEILAFDLSSHDVRLVGHLPLPAYRPQVCALDGKLYVLGGASGPTYFSEILLFDPETEELSVAGQLPGGRALGGVAEAGGRLYYVGGRDQARHLDEVVEFDPSTGESRVLMNLPTPIYSPAVAAAGDCLYVIGGEYNDSARIVRSNLILEIDLATNTVIRTASLPSARSWTAAAAIGGDVYVLGGWVGESLDDIVHIGTDSAQLRVEVVGRLDQTAARHVLAVVDDHLVLIGGDLAARQRELPVIEIDPETLTQVRHRFRGSI